VQAQEFLEYVKKTKSKNTWKEYRNGLKKFSEWYGKDLDTILMERKCDLESGDAVKRRRFEHKLEEFHRALLNEGYAVNSCRTMTLGLVQLFNYFDMDMKTRVISAEAKKTVETEKSYPLTIEEVRAMYAVADSLRDKVLLLMGKDLGLRLADVLSIKRNEIPDLDQETPIPFQRITNKEKVLAKGFLSDETIAILKAYLPTLKSKLNPYLFPSNGEGPITDDTVNNILCSLCEKAKIKVPKGQALTFHCFRKMFLTYCIEAGVGLTAGKLMCGKAVAKSDSTYIHNARLKKLFLQLQKMIRVTDVATYMAGQDRVALLEQTIETLKQEVLSHRTAWELSAKKNEAMRKELTELRGLIRIVDERRQKTDAIMDKLFSDSEFREFVSKRLKQLRITEEAEQDRASLEP
jgi:integrase